ncbi:hypothetical protein N473_07010 [Pseudoalteromonas luteoviolacea CPMOR-1]|uniref:Uncharacterized protein n=1 Tax=Pseudoalteromonas luteoviolacea CPMOR-1 TaxID=1365248 RepID=A0A167H4B8_9GAMM|nr:hypothetical protein [Pseudoalteromonas luteoviolacea]KZN57618.1 hypothetical protein N473_07010 [Pseudoalteromonas luteoviolacea CPMOR-1]
MHYKKLNNLASNLLSKVVGGSAGGGGGNEPQISPLNGSGNDPITISHQLPENELRKVLGGNGSGNDPGSKPARAYQQLSHFFLTKP